MHFESNERLVKLGTYKKRQYFDASQLLSRHGVDFAILKYIKQQDVNKIYFDKVYSEISKQLQLTDNTHTHNKIVGILTDLIARNLLISNDAHRTAVRYYSITPSGNNTINIALAEEEFCRLIAIDLYDSSYLNVEVKSYESYGETRIKFNIRLFGKIKGAVVSFILDSIKSEYDVAQIKKRGLNIKPSAFANLKLDNEAVSAENLKSIIRIIKNETDFPNRYGGTPQILKQCLQAYCTVEYNAESNVDIDGYASVLLTHPIEAIRELSRIVFKYLDE